MTMRTSLACGAGMGAFLLLHLLPAALEAQDPKAMVARSIDDREARFGELAQEIWDLAELRYLEERSSDLLRAELRGAGFRITEGVLLAEATAEQAERVGPDFVYRSLVGGREPPLDYRLPAGSGAR